MYVVFRRYASTGRAVALSFSIKTRSRQEIITNNHKPKSFLSLVQHPHKDPSPQENLPERAPSSGSPLLENGNRRGPVLRPACLRAREPWSALEGFPDDLDYCEDVELSLGKILAYDCL